MLYVVQNVEGYLLKSWFDSLEDAEAAALELLESEEEGCSVEVFEVSSRAVRQFVKELKVVEYDDEGNEVTE